MFKETNNQKSHVSDKYSAANGGLKRNLTHFIVVTLSTRVQRGSSLSLSLSLYIYIYIYILVAKGLGCCNKTSSFCTTKPGGLVTCYGTAAGRSRTTLPTVWISRPMISISHEATGRQVIFSSRFYSGNEALCPVIMRMDDCYNLSDVLVTKENSQPRRWESLPTFQCGGSCFNYQNLSVHCDSQ